MIKGKKMYYTFLSPTNASVSCLPFVYSTQGPYIVEVTPEKIPPGLQIGCVPSNGSTPIIEVDAKDRWVSLNFVMAATFMSITFSVDEHDMWLYEVDGHFVEPQKIQALNMYPAERYAVLIKLNKKKKDYTIRVHSKLSQVMAGFGIFRYKNRDRSDTTPSKPFVDYGGWGLTPDIIVLDAGYVHFPPFPPKPPGQKADQTIIMSLGRWTSAWKWTMSGKGIMPVDGDAYSPLLYDPYGHSANDPTLTIHTKNGSWVDLVLRVGALPGEPAEISHAIHKHGSKTWFIGQGVGIWNYSSVEEAMKVEPQSFNLKNPNYRDMVMTTFSGGAWFVLRYQVTNPMPCLMHCHVETHLSGGMGMVIMDGIDKWPAIPPEYGADQKGNKRGLPHH
jgi:FtsP/CotA-like multicopper oxidase with cupredoxin domain